jgi:hypothetical protein
MEIRKALKQILIDALASFVFFTATLSPYMIFIVGVNLQQYLAWLGMQVTIVPPLGIIYSEIARRLKKT